MTMSTARATMTACLLAATVAACQPAPRPRANAAASAACRAEVDRVYAAQNRRDLSQRDQRDTPFAGSYNSGITSRGLSSQYDRDNMYGSCLNNASAPSAPAGAAAVPAGNPGSGTAFAPGPR